MRPTTPLLFVALEILAPSGLVGEQLTPPKPPAAEMRVPGSSIGLPLPASDEGAFILLDHEIVAGIAGANDESRGISIGPDGWVYVTGYVTLDSEHGRDIWLAKYDHDLGELDSTTVNGVANGDDEGYTMAFDHSGYLYLIGYMTESGQSHNIWLGKFDANLDLVDETTIGGSTPDDDDGYGILYDDPTGRLYVAGTVREMGEGANIWLAIFDTDLAMVDEFRKNGPVNDTDKARFVTIDSSRRLFASGSITVDLARDYDIWVGKFEDDLTFVDHLVVPGPTADEDKGYGIVASGSGTVFVTGTMIEPGESYNIWMAEIDGNLNLLADETFDGPVHGEDVAYGMVADGAGNLYHAGVCTEADGGSNIWLARYDSDLDLEAWTTEDGPGGGYDTGLEVAVGPDNDLFVSGVVTDGSGGLDIWIGHYRIGIIFADGLESGGTGQWTSATP